MTQTTERRNAVGGIIFWTIVFTVIVSILLALFGPEFRGSDIGAARRSGATLLVLPIANLTGDPSREFLADGLTEELIATLAHRAPDELRVIARTSSMAFKNNRSRVDEIAAAIGVTHMLEGSLREQDGTARVTAQLIDARDHTPLWAESFESGEDGLLSLQVEIAERITDALAVPTELRSGAQNNPGDETRLSLLRGRHLLNRNTLEDTQRAIPFLEAAVLGLPGYSDALAALAEANFRLGQVRLAREAVAAALTADPDHGGANRVRANILTYEDWDFEGALESFERALANDPDPLTRHSYAFLLAYLGRTGDALAQIDTALVEDPISTALLADKGLVANMMGEHRVAIEQCNRTLELDPDNIAAQDCMTNAYLGLGYADSAMTFARSAWAARGRDPALLAGVEADAELQVRTWRERELEDLERRAQGSTAGVRRARLYISLGDTTSALQLLQGAVFTRQPAVLWLGVDPAFDGIRGTAAMNVLLEEIGLL